MRLGRLLPLLLVAGCRADAPPAGPAASTGAPRPGDSALSAPTGPADAPDTARPDPAAGAAFAGTVRRTARSPARGGVAVLQRVRTGGHAGFDRIVFTFDEGPLPGYTVEYVDRPVYNCGEGRVVRLAGEAWLRIRLAPAQAHTDAGHPTAAPRERRPGLPVLLEAELTCDFEADVTWVLGLAAPNPYRVSTLGTPPRLVVDVRH